MLLAFAAAALVIVLVPLVASRLVGQPVGISHMYEIPAGTAARLATGDRVDVLPADLRFGLQDRLVVVNHDDSAHQVGPFTVGPGERLDRRLSEAVSFSGFCSLHSTDRITIEVEA